MNLRNASGAFALAVALLGGCSNDNNSSSNNASLSVSPTSLSVSAGELGTAPTATVTVSVANPTTNLTVDPTSTSVGISDVSFTANSDTSGTLTVTYRTPATLGPGSYDDTITLNVCYDSACTQPISGSPATITSVYTVSLTGSSSSSSSGGSSSSSSSSSSGSSSSGSSGSSSSSSSSSGSSSGSASLPGIYYGTLKVGSASHTFFGLIDANGNGWFVQKDVNNYVVYAPATIPVSGSSFSVAYTGYDDGEKTPSGSSSTETGTLTGTLGSSDLSGSLAVSGSTVATYSVAPEASVYQQVSSVADISGSYSGSFSAGGTSYKPVLTFSATGAITGTDSSQTGCTYTGTVTTPDSAVNAYDISLSSSCLGAAFSGVGSYVPAANLLETNSFKTAISNGTYGIYLNLTQ